MPAPHSCTIITGNGISWKLGKNDSIQEIASSARTWIYSRTPLRSCCGMRVSFADIHICAFLQSTGDLHLSWSILRLRWIGHRLWTCKCETYQACSAMSGQATQLPTRYTRDTNVHRRCTIYASPADAKRIKMINTKKESLSDFCATKPDEGKHNQRIETLLLYIIVILQHLR